MAAPDAPPDRSGWRRLALGRLVTWVMVRAPALWPVARGFVRRFFDDRASSWDERTGAGSPEHLAPLAAALLEVPEPERALDVGTGTGAAALLLAREFPHARIRGIDVSGEMIRVAQRRVGLDPEGRIAFRVADAAALPYPDDHFDLVTLLNMPPFLEELARVLRPGGHLVIAASRGRRTPFHTPPAALERGLPRVGLELVGDGGAAAGTYSIARRPRPR